MKIIFKSSAIYGNQHIVQGRPSHHNTGYRQNEAQNKDMVSTRESTTDRRIRRLLNTLSLINRHNKLGHCILHCRIGQRLRPPFLIDRVICMHHINLPERACLGHDLCRHGGIGARLPGGCVVVAFAGCVESRIVRPGGAGYGEFVDACGRRTADAEVRDGPAIYCCVCGSFGDGTGCGEGGQSHEGN